MKVKLRADAHCAPVQRGVYWSRGERSFVLSGPPALYALVDDQLDALLDGTSVDAMVAAAGDEAARPVIEHVVRALVAQDVLIDLDAVQGPVPDAATAREHAELLAYLEANCAEPYLAFAAVRAAQVAVVGAGPAADAVRRGLAANGIAPDPARPALTVLVDDCDLPLDLLAAASGPDLDTPVLPVVALAELALVGPVCATPQELRSFLAVRARAADWQRSGDEAPVSRPIGGVLAGSLAAQAVLAHLAGTGDGGRTALVVHGHAAQTTAVPVPEPGDGAVWRTVDPDQEPESARAEPEVSEQVSEQDAGPADGAAPAAADAELQQIHRLAAGLTARWTGVARWGRDLDLPQLPVSLVTAETVAGPGRSPAPADAASTTAPGPYLLGWGNNRAAAGLTAMLAVLRHRVTEEQAAEEQPAEDRAAEGQPAGDRAAADGPGLPAAGLTRAHWLADGLLRHAAPEALTRSEGTPLTWDDLESSTVRSLWSLLQDYFGVPVALRTYTVPGLDWQLCTAVRAATGEVLAAQWGPSRLSAGYAALLAATARAQFDEAAKNAPQSPVLPPDPIGTWSLEVAPDRQVHSCLRQLLDRARAEGLTPRARQLARDAAVGELPLVCGPVWLA
ncbi:hypothetical protein GXW83_22740 [Streptacidiphilus sp. PB12-B1b]|uniref:hypothetical protein n=1 Tax=Streptacidiphilus sp. PB12-B1b TaxID=2705012 RepID=UPI0015FA0376|nr:hypothetical protein [Streptacidiphilus sp. PB12-B1b]QMU78094.1 hypothetical protein GXW83_22740 [Streptacidiphilus sp. PB12-B1b]